MEACAGVAQEPPRLYDSGGIRPEAVKQGTLGSCYFHSVVAALAQSNPRGLEKMIHENHEGTYTVSFADGKKENVYPQDLGYGRASDFDQSDGLWVALLLRAYAQRVLRESLIAALDQSDLFPFLKPYAEDFVATNDPLLLAYDGAIRSEVDQEGAIDRTKLEARLRDQMKSIAAPEGIKNSFLQLLTSKGFLDAIAETVQKNGELFGAYRAVGQGGLAERVMKVFAGSSQFIVNESEEEAASALRRAKEAGAPIVACTGGSRFEKQKAAGQPLPPDTKPWFVAKHCYTVMNYESDLKSITLRNPWYLLPPPNGVFVIPLNYFAQGFQGIVTTSP